MQEIVKIKKNFVSLRLCELLEFSVAPDSYRDQSQENPLQSVFQNLKI
jgi:hypothetical protein